MDKWTNNLNEDPDFKLCESVVEALDSDATKLWLVTILRALLKHDEANEIYWIFNKFLA